MRPDAQNCVTTRRHARINLGQCTQYLACSVGTPIVYKNDFVWTAGDVVQNTFEASIEFGKNRFFVINWNGDRDAGLLIHRRAFPLK